MKRRIGYTILVFLFLAAAAFVYINNIFLPIQFKQIIIDKTRRFLGRDVTIGRITCGPIQGVNVHDIIIYQKNATGQPFIVVKTLSFKILLPPVLKNQKLIIPSAKVTQPMVNITRQNDGSYNFTDIIDKIKNRSSPNRVLLGGLTIENGTLAYIDQELETPAREIFEDVQFKASITFRKTIKFSLSSAIKNTKAKISASGQYDINNAGMEILLIPSEIDLARFLPYVYKKSQLRIASGSLESGDIHLKKHDATWDISGPLNISLLGGEIGFNSALKANLIRAEMHAIFSAEQKQIDAKFQIRELHLQNPTDKEFRGNLVSDAFRWIYENGAHIIQSDFTIKNGYLAFAPAQSLKGDMTAKGAKITYAQGRTEIETALQIEQAELQLSNDVRLTGLMTSSESTASIENGIIRMQSVLKLTNGLLGLPNEITLSADPDINLSLEYNPYSEGQLTYGGSIQLERASLSNIPIFEQINDITGVVYVETDKIHTQALRLLSVDTGLLLNGSLSNFRNPSVDITYSSPGISLDKFAEVFRKYLTQIKSEISGNAKIEGHYKGLISAPQNADINITAAMDNAVFKSKYLPGELSALTGKIQYKYDLIKLADLSTNFLGENYKVNASLEDFSRPKLLATIASEKLNVNADINILRKVLQIVSLRGFYLNAAMDIKSDVHFEKGDSPYLNLRGTVNLNLEDLPSILPKQQNLWKTLKLTGNLESEVFFKGFINQWKDWQCVVSAKSSNSRLSGLLLDNLALNYEQRDQNINLFKMTSNFYNGLLTLNSSADLTTQASPFKLTAILQKTDLAMLKNDTRLSDHKVSGTLNAKTNLTGNLSEIPQSLSGDASLTVSDGEIWQFQFLNNLWKAFNLPQFSTIKFTDAAGDFKIENQHVKTDNLVLDSRQMKLEGKGTVGFDQSIDFKVKSKSNEAYVSNAESIIQIPGKYLTKTVDLVDFQVGGTLKSPKIIKVSPHLPELKLIDKTKGLLMDGVKNVLEGIF